MAVVENIFYQPMLYDPSSQDAEFGFIPKPNTNPIEAFPQIFHSDGEPWSEANKYAFYSYYDLHRDIKTVSREMNHLARYADWLEREGLHWLHFPKRKHDRCLFRFRGFLIECRENLLLAPSTISQIMSATIRFYRWASSDGLVEPRSQLWDDNLKLVKFFDKVGFSRTMKVTSSELSIANRKRTGRTLEDGLLPLTKAQASTLMKKLKEQSNYQLYLIFKVAFLTGCRYETVTTLTLNALNCSYQDPNSPHLMRVKVGPGTDVKTKGAVSGVILFPRFLVSELVDYYNSTDAIIRRSRAASENIKFIFLTNQSNLYVRSSFSTLIRRLKDTLIEEGFTEFSRFKFHQLRATYGTMLMKSALNSNEISVSNAIEYVKAAMLHKEASTTWLYVKFLEQEPIEEAFMELLWKMLTGTEREANKIVDDLSGRYDG